MTQQASSAAAGTASGAHPDQARALPAVSLTLRLPALPSAAALARQHVRQLLRAWQLSAVSDPAQLMSSELVANAAAAAQPMCDAALLDGRAQPPEPVELGLRRTAVSLIIEVSDPSPEPPVLQQADPADEGGRGLLIVEILSTRWGYYVREGGGKVVWCEISLAGESPAGDGPAGDGPADMLALSSPRSAARSAWLRPDWLRPDWLRPGQNSVPVPTWTCGPGWPAGRSQATGRCAISAMGSAAQRGGIVVCARPQHHPASWHTVPSA